MTSFNVWFPITLLIFALVAIMLNATSEDFKNRKKEKESYPFITFIVFNLIYWGIGCFSTFGFWQIILISFSIYSRLKPPASNTSPTPTIYYILSILFGVFILFQCGGFDAMLDYMGYIDLLKYKIVF